MTKKEIIDRYQGKTIDLASKVDLPYDISKEEFERRCIGNLIVFHHPDYPDFPEDIGRKLYVPVSVNEDGHFDAVAFTVDMIEENIVLVGPIDIGRGKPSWSTDNMEYYWQMYSLAREPSEQPVFESNNTKNITIGDRVRVINVNNQHLIEYVKGKEGTVKYVDKDNDALIEFDEMIQGGHSGNINTAQTKQGHGYWVNLQYLEKIQTEEPVFESNEDNKEGFNVGDRVRVKPTLQTVEPLNTVLRGKTGVIKYIESGTSYNVLVEFDKNINGHNGNTPILKIKDGHGWWVSNEDLEKIFPAEEPVFESEILKPDTEFTVGTRVKVTVNTHTKNNTNLLGKTGVIAGLDNKLILVNFDEDVGGHDGGSIAVVRGIAKTPERHGWWLPGVYLEVISGPEEQPVFEDNGDFNIGDKIKVKPGYYPSEKLGIIKSIKDDSALIHFDDVIPASIYGDKHKYWVHLSRLQNVSIEEPVFERSLFDTGVITESDEVVYGEIDPDTIISKYQGTYFNIEQSEMKPANMTEDNMLDFLGKPLYSHDGLIFVPFRFRLGNYEKCFDAVIFTPSGEVQEISEAGWFFLGRGFRLLKDVPTEQPVFETKTARKILEWTSTFDAWISKNGRIYNIPSGMEHWEWILLNLNQIKSEIPVLSYEYLLHVTSEDNKKGKSVSESIYHLFINELGWSRITFLDDTRNIIITLPSLRSVVDIQNYIMDRIDDVQGSDVTMFIGYRNGVGFGSPDDKEFKTLDDFLMYETFG